MGVADKHGDGAVAKNSGEWEIMHLDEQTREA